MSAWLGGVRLRPGFLADSVKNETATTAAELNPAPITADRLQQIFQRLNRPEDIFFRYEITDGGTGRDLQNRADPQHRRTG